MITRLGLPRYALTLRNLHRKAGPQFPLAHPATTCTLGFRNHAA